MQERRRSGLGTAGDKCRQRRVLDTRQNPRNFIDPGNQHGESHGRALDWPKGNARSGETTFKGRRKRSDTPVDESLKQADSVGRARCHSASEPSGQSLSRHGTQQLELMRIAEVATVANHEVTNSIGIVLLNAPKLRCRRRNNPPVDEPKLLGTAQKGDTEAG